MKQDISYLMCLFTSTGISFVLNVSLTRIKQLNDNLFLKVIIVSSSTIKTQARGHLLPGVKIQSAFFYLSAILFRILGL